MSVYPLTSPIQIGLNSVGAPNVRLNKSIVASINGFSPNQIANLTLWLDGADTNSFAFSSGTNIQTWFDKSGLGNHATASTTKPVLGSLNGNTAPLLTFSTNNTNSSFFLGNFASTYTGTQLQSFAVAVMYSTSAGYGRILGLARPGVNDFADPTTTFAFIRNLNVSDIMVGRNNTYLAVSTPGYSQAFLVQSSQNGSTESIGVNGTLTPSSTDTGIATGFNISSYAIGANPNTTDTGSFWSGYIAEVIYYTTALTTAQRQQVEGYLAWKWGIQSSLPTEHPYKTINISGPVVPTIRGLPSVIPIGISFVPFPAWVPSNIPNLALWLDAADYSTFTFSTGTSINTWLDKSGRNNTATAGSAKPAYLSSSLNSRPTVSFTAVTGSPSTSTYFFGNFATTFTGSTLQAFIVGTLSSSANSFGRLFSLGKGTSLGDLENDTALPFCRNNNQEQIFNGRGTSQFLATNITYNTPFILQSSQVPSTEYIGLNGNTQTSLSTGISVNFNITQFCLGTTVTLTDTLGSFTGYISELIYYQNNLTSDDVQKVEGYLAWKWGLTANLPSNHLYKNAPPLPQPLLPKPFIA